MVNNDDFDKKEFAYLIENISKIVQLASKILNTNELNIIEYLKEDNLIFQLNQYKVKYPKNKLETLDNAISWLDKEWYSYKLSERMTIIYSLKLF